MTTPERPSLADTLARIDAAIAERAAKLDAQPPCLRCARKSLIDSPFCAYHLPCPIDQDAVIAKGSTFTVTVPAGYEIIRPAGRRIEIATAPRTPEPRPGWLARALRRLFT